MIVRCTGCFRVEDRGADPPVVLTEGGQRRIVAPERTAFDAVVRSLRGAAGPVAAACPRCGMPMLGDRGPGGLLVPWSFRSRDGELTFARDGAPRIDDRAVELSAASAWMASRFPPAREPGRRFGVVPVLMLTLMATPILVWVFSVAFVSTFLYLFPESPP